MEIIFPELEKGSLYEAQYYYCSKRIRAYRCMIEDEQNLRANPNGKLWSLHFSYQSLVVHYIHFNFKM